jgi:hypothetical protein
VWPMDWPCGRIVLAGVEDRATLGSDPSADAGGCTGRQGFSSAFPSFCLSGSPESAKPKGVWREN